MQGKNSRKINGIPQETQFWCEYKNKNVKHRYFLHPQIKKAFGRICDEDCDNMSCEWKKGN